MKYGNDNLTDSIDKVVQGGYCSGCGACAYISKGSMYINRFGEYEPKLGQIHESVNDVCPFLCPEENEDFLAQKFFPKLDRKTDELGYIDTVFAAHVNEGRFRADGSSGGMGSWLGVELLRKGMIDAVIHVKPACRNHSSAPFFEYGVSTTEEEIRYGAHSHYHVVEMSRVLQHIMDVKGNYLVIGVPCFVKAVRRLQLHNEVIRTRVRFVASLICGHMKSINWSLSLGWAVGIPPADFKEIKFRVKSENLPAKAYFYGVKAKVSDEDFLVYDSASVVGGKFNLGAMMLNACNFCDDIVGETADISIGDAWLPKYANDWRGKNMVVVRNPELTTLFREANSDGRLSLEEMSVEEAALAQAGGFRQRREGLFHRIEKRRSIGEWYPIKRAFSGVPRPKFYRRMIYDLRSRCASESRIAFLMALENDNFTIYTRRMKVMFKLLRLVEVGFSSPQIILQRIQRIMTNWKR